MTPDSTTVPAEPTSPVPSPEGTPTPSSVTPEVTPTQPAEDARLAEFQAKLDRYEQDLRNQKSTFQRRENELQQAARQREEELRAEIEKARVADMDEDELKIYRQEQALLRSQELETRVQQLETEKQELAAFQQAYNWFLQNDVPASALTADQGYDALFESGWRYINEERQRLKNMVAAPPQAPVTPAPKAPAVVTSTAGLPMTGTTWADLEAKYGSREQVYRLVETGQLPPSIIPGFARS